MPPIGSDHVGSTNDFNYWLMRQLMDRAVISVRNPLRLRPRSEPQPDVLVLKLRSDRYHASLPVPEDVLLLIEVADTTLRYDRDRKLPRYAKAGIPEVWIADLRGSRLLVYREPRDGKYTERVVPGPEDTISPEAFPDVVFHVAAVLA